MGSPSPPTWQGQDGSGSKDPKHRGILVWGAGQRKWEAGRGYFETTGPSQGPPWKNHLPFWEPSSRLELLSSRTTEKGGEGKGEREGTRRQWEIERNRRTEVREDTDSETPRCVTSRRPGGRGGPRLAAPGLYCVAPVSLDAWPLPPGLLCPACQECG